MELLIRNIFLFVSQTRKESANRHSDRSMRSASATCVVEESVRRKTLLHSRDVSTSLDMTNHCTHSANVPCVSVEMTRKMGKSVNNAGYINQL